MEKNIEPILSTMCLKLSFRMSASYMVKKEEPDKKSSSSPLVPGVGIELFIQFAYYQCLTINLTERSRFSLSLIHFQYFMIQTYKKSGSLSNIHQLPWMKMNNAFIIRKFHIVKRNNIFFIIVFYLQKVAKLSVYNIFIV